MHLFYFGFKFNTQRTGFCVILRDKIGVILRHEWLKCHLCESKSMIELTNNHLYHYNNNSAHLHLFVAPIF